MNDIGNYDKAAMRFGYAGLVDVDMDAKQSSQKGQDYLQQVDGFGGIQGVWAGGSHSLHYSQYNDTYNILGKCTTQTDPTIRSPRRVTASR